MEEIKNFINSHSSPNGCVALTRSERDELVRMVEELSNSVTELTNTKTELENKVTELNKQIEKMKEFCDCEYCINVISGDEFTVENTNKTVCEYCMENNKKLWKCKE